MENVKINIIINLKFQVNLFPFFFSNSWRYVRAKYFIPVNEEVHINYEMCKDKLNK